MSCGKMQKAI
jgi:hypothetical protein